MTIENFEQLNINENLKKAILELNYTTPTPIQALAIPKILDNKDVIGQAQTGTGKTAAFAIPIIEKIDEVDDSIQALILLPTRELAIQVTKEVRKLIVHMDNIRVVPVYGGQSYDIQISALKKHPQIIVGTPGRIIDLMSRSLIRFDKLRILVLDEADEMLKMGFQEDLETILEKTPKTRQSVLFSATMPDPILKIANTYLKNYELIKIENKTITVDRIEQFYYNVKTDQKLDILVRLLDFYNLKSSIVFCNTKRDVDELVLKLQGQNYMTEGIHGDLKQGQRDRVMNSFRNNNVRILVATDVAARGLDINNVEAIFNYDLPLEDEVYVHRIGRTGRAGKYGMAFTFITKRQEYKLQLIEKYINTKINKGKIPTPEEIKQTKSLELFEVVKEKLVNLSNVETHPLAEKLTNDGFTKDQIINALISMVGKETTKDYANIVEDSNDRRPRQDRDDRSRRNDRNDNRFDRRDRNDNRFDRKDRTENKSRRETKSNNIEEKRDTVRPKKDNNSKQVLLFVDAGTNKDVRVGDILDLLKQDFNINKNDIGTIEITKKATYVELYEKDANSIISSSKSKLVKGKEVKVEIIQ
ncbi:MAG: srmB [Haloplasmataceae bacterium]|jgi:ATP-dependent RNA helicase DeaD|nr:srmB [Haloplasmataceae bacterium]